MNDKPALLPDELVWSEDGHLSEIAIAALGDGQDAIMPEKARDHALSCETCAAQMGHAAMLSSELGAVMRAPIAAPQKSPEGERAAVPWLAIIGAIFVAAAGSLSSIFDSTSLADAPSAFAHQAPLALRAGSALLRGITNGLGPLASFGCAALLVAAGAMVARSMPRAWSDQGASE
jgi:hypothetical protein